jgi:thioredoxin-dependent peroxiredoxin
VIKQTVTSVTFNTRVRDVILEGSNPYTWKDLNSDEIFKGKGLVLFALPVAFTPARSRFLTRIRCSTI